MKLLKFKVGDIPKEKQFRSLYSGFEVDFHSLDNNGYKIMKSFNPFCFTGLNGNGKSNVLEALAIIFFHMECCVAKFKPTSFAQYFRENECTLDAFYLEYLIWRKGESDCRYETLYKVIIQKKVGSVPKLFHQSYPFSDKESLIEESLLTPKLKIGQEPVPAPAKIYLPDIVVGYSSGENEILSIPFRKSRLINFDKYHQDSINESPFEEPENSLIYIDSTMSQSVLLAALIFEDDSTLKLLREELGIVDLLSFRININNHYFEDYKNKKKSHVLEHCNEFIDKLKKCATCWQEFGMKDDFELFSSPQLILDFFIDENTKKAFKYHFKTAFNLFRFLQMLYELNSLNVSEHLKEDIYKSRGVYTDEKLSQGASSENVFFFQDFLILKRIKDLNSIKPLFLKEFSDGEHQFLHVMGICLILKDRRSLILLDEPETHFNSHWRSKFIQILSNSINAGEEKSSKKINPHLLKDFLLTTHSPFIISDCLPNNVVVFQRNNEKLKVIVKKASELEINTYGSSIDYILKNLFNTKLVSNKSLEELKKIIKNGSISDLRNAIEYFGESSVKQFLFKRLYELQSEEVNDDNNKSSKVEK